MKEKQRYKPGHHFSLGLAIGIPLGVPLGVSIGNIGIGPLIGLLLGVTIGFVMEKQLNPDPIELTREEKRSQVKWLRIAIAVGLFLACILLSVYLIGN